MSIIVSNTTPVSNLIRIGQLPLLARLYGQVIIPLQVAQELDEGAHILGDWRQAPGAEALKVETPLDGPFLRQLLTILDEGESAAIALAVERKAELLLLDEVAGRPTANLHALRIAGTLGLLLEARRVGLLGCIAPLISALEEQNFRIHPDLRRRVLEQAGEVP